MSSLKMILFAMCCMFMGSHVYCDVFTADTPFHTQYGYNTAQGLTMEAEGLFEDRLFGDASGVYARARDSYLYSKVNDPRLFFRIEVGLTLSEMFNNQLIMPMGPRLVKVYNEFNLANDKMEIETIGELNDNKPILAAK